MKRLWVVGGLLWSSAAFAQTDGDQGGESSPSSPDAVKQVYSSGEEADSGGESGDQPQGASVQSSQPGGLWGPVRVGATAALGIPHPLNYGLDLMYEDWIGFGFTTGKFSHTIDSTEIELANWDVRVRYHPWAGSFFVGAAYGQQELLGKASEDLELKANGMTLTIPTQMQVQIDTTYLTPHVGWFSVWDSGFTIGFELGVQVALNSSTDFQAAFTNVGAAQEEDVKKTDKYKDMEKSIKDVGDKIGKSTLPYLTLLRLGWMF